MQLRKLFVVGVLTVCLLPANRIFGEDSGHDYPEMMFIVDSSGSMSEDAGGKSKIEATKEVMGKIVPDLASEVRIGLTAYGHRRKGDCSDIEVIIPPGSADHEALLQRVYELQPRGKTPISSAILSVAGLLKTKEVETTIVLVSDGIETCGGDPCEVARQLKATGCKFVIHVVGFDVGAAAAQQLVCIAAATGGKYFAANDTDSLLKALQEVSAEVAQKVAAAKTETVRAQTGLGKLQITMPQGAHKSIAAVNIVRVTDEKPIKRVDRPSASSTHPLPSGKYTVVVGFGTPNLGQPTWTEVGEVTVRKGETRHLQLGSISFNIPTELVENEWKNRINVDKVILTDAGSNEPVVTVLDNNNGYYNFVSKPVVAGMYNVLFKYSTNSEAATIVARNVQVNPGKDTVVTLNTGIQFTESETDVVGWDLIPKQVETAAQTEDGTVLSTPAPILQARAFSPIGGGSANLWYPYLVPQGHYDIVVHVKGMDEPLPVAEDVEFGPGKMLRFDAGF